MLLANLLLGILTVIPHAVFPLPDRALILIVDAVALALIFAIAYYPRFGFRIRAWLYLILIYCFWAWLSFQVQGLSVIFLTGVPLLAALLLGLRSGMVALVFCMASLFFMGIIFFPDFQVGEARDLSSTQSWLLMLLNYTFVAGLLTISCGVLINRLESALDVSHSALRSLNQQGEDLNRQNRELRQAIERRAC